MLNLILQQKRLSYLTLLIKLTQKCNNLAQYIVQKSQNSNLTSIQIMKKTQVRKKVPIRYKQNQAYKYQSINSNNNKNEQIDDGTQSNDNQQNQKYMQSSYLQKYSDRPQQQNHHKQTYQEESSIGEQSFRESKQNGQGNTIKGFMNPYQLTFKKQKQKDNNDFHYQEQHIVQLSSHMNQTDRNFQDESQSFEQVRYHHEKQNQSLQNKNQFDNLDFLLQNREKLYQKYHSAQVNYHYYHAKPSKTIQEKHKEYLLSLLTGQLQKNIFINGLKLNFYLSKSKRNDFTENENSQGKIDSNDQLEQQNQEVNGSNKVSSGYQKSKDYLDKSLTESIQPKLIIFEQITSGIVRKKLFQCFDLIASLSKIESKNKPQTNSNVIAKQSSKRLHKAQQPSSPSEQNHSKRFQLNPYKSSERSNKYSENGKQNSQSLVERLKENENLSQSQQDQQQQDNEDHIEDDSQLSLNLEVIHKMQELMDYIQGLKREARQTDKKLKRYFLKWKIYLFQLILQDYQQEFEMRMEKSLENIENPLSLQQQIDQPDQLNEQDEIQNQSEAQSDDENYNIQTDQGHQELQNIYSHSKKHSLKTPLYSLPQKEYQSHQSHKNLKKPKQKQSSRAHYSNQRDRSFSVQQEVQQEDPIKQKKMILKSFLHQGYLQEFWDCFTEHYTHNKLMIISKKLRQENLKKNVMYGLKLNTEFREKQRAMDEYYEEIADSQDHSQYRTAQLFHRTNLKAKYFFEFLKISKHIKCAKKLDSLPLRIGFLKIYNFSEFQKRKETHIQRFFLLQRTKKLFKPFQAWKEATVLSHNYIKLKSFTQEKDLQIAAQYFSVLQLLYKQSLIQQKKASNFYKRKQLSKVFGYLHFLSEQSRQTKTKQRQLTQYLMFSRGKQFYESFYEFYGQKVLQHRINIRSQKLIYSRQKQFTNQRLQQWRNHIIKKQSYQAIEYRLVKLRQKEIKQNMFDIWINELDRRLNQRDQLEQSAQHKDWLVKYYGSLCEIATSGQQRD